MSFIEDNSMDFINYAYVLHEMPEVRSVLSYVGGAIVFIDD